MMDSAVNKFKVVLIGDSTVGKTCLFNQFKERKVAEETNATVGVDYCVKRLMVDGHEIKLELWDTGGQERFRSLTPIYYRNADCLILVYDISTRLTFDSLKKWYENMVEKISSLSDVYLVLIGNKSDLKRDIETTEGETFAKDNDFNLFVETSTRDSGQIEQLFTDIGQALAARRNASHPPEEATGIRIFNYKIVDKENGCCG